MSKESRMRLSKMTYNGLAIKDPAEFGITEEEARQLRLKIMRHPCECGGLDGILISADIDIEKKMATRWEMAFCPNLLTPMEEPPRKVFYTITHCPICGRKLPVVTSDKCGDVDECN